MRSNPLLLTPISGRVWICTGCKVLFTDKERKQPHDLVFRIQMRRQYTKDGKKKTALKKSNVFFHMRDLGCVRQISELCHVERNNIYVTNKDFVELTCEHIDFLKKCHYWDYIKRNRENVTKDWVSMSGGNSYSSQCTLGTKMGHNNTLMTPNNKSK